MYDRMMGVNLSVGEMVVTIICAYAPYVGYA